MLIMPTTLSTRSTFMEKRRTPIGLPRCARIEGALLCGILAAAIAPTAAAATASAKQMEEWRSEIGTTLFVPNSLPRLDPRTFSSFSPAPGVIAERVTYGTEFGMRIPAVIYRPEHAEGNLPGMVVVNGHGGDKYSWYSFYTGILYARAGAVVVTYDPIGEGERNDDHRSGTREHDTNVNVAGYPEHLGGLMIADVMQAVSYLRQRKDVDPKRIAIMGYSMGSFVAALAGAYDTRIHAVVLSGGGDLDGPNGYWDSSTKLMCQAIPYQSLRVLGDRPAVIYALHQQRGPTLLINGAADTLVDIPHHMEPYFAAVRQRVTAITGRKDGLFDTIFIPDVSHRPNWVTRPAALWLLQQLHFPHWTKEEIESMPETHISGWADKNHVDMDKGYIQEEREGGVMALTTSVPNVPRAELNVLDPSEWERAKEGFVYSSWVKQTLQGLNTGKPAYSKDAVKKGRPTK